jgi:hypothetical protein
MQSPATTADQLTEAQREATWLLAEGRLLPGMVGVRVGVARVTVWRGGLLPAFAALVQDYTAQLDAETYGVALARKQNWVIALGRLAERIERRLDTRLSGESITAYRGVLDDIAKELGDRAQKVNLEATVDVRTPATTVIFHLQKSRVELGPHVTENQLPRGGQR